jgi:23S rRNA (guanosine2251-2'-O)-methyltransferase
VTTPAAGGRRRGASSRGRPEAGVLGGEQVEGRQAVAELLRARRRPVRAVWVDDRAAGGAAAALMGLAEAAGVVVRVVPRSRLEAAAATDAPQGVIAWAAPVAPARLADLVPGSGSPNGAAAPPMLVVLDGVTDPHNLGAIMRTALCAGATGVVIGRHRAARWSPAAVKAAAGAVEHLAVAVVPGIPAALVDLERSGVWTVGLDATGPGDLWDLQVATEPVALVLGAEGAGLARLTRQRCQVIVRIPLAGPLGALNVAGAAAVACFEVARLRRGPAPTSPIRTSQRP